jgi:hypothetical protein
MGREGRRAAWAERRLRAAWAERGEGRPGQRGAEGSLGREGRRAAWAEKGGRRPGQRGAEGGLGREGRRAALAERRRRVAWTERRRLLFSNTSVSCCNTSLKVSSPVLSSPHLTSLPSPPSPSPPPPPKLSPTLPLLPSQETAVPAVLTNEPEGYTLDFSNLENVSYGTKITSVRTLDTPTSSTVEALP